MEKNISIHVPRVEDDTIVEGLRWAYPISIHVPRVEDDKRINIALNHPI